MLNFRFMMVVTCGFFVILLILACQCKKNNDDELKKLQKEIDNLKEIVKSLQKTDQHKHDIKNKRLLLDANGQLPGQHKEGAVYTIWGRKACPSNGTDTVYSGYAGGSFFNYPGGGVDYVCLPSDPEFGIQITVTANAHMYGAEYETSYFGPAEDQNVPCAVCRSITGVSSIMIPARKTCYSGWKQEYHGRLAAAYYNHALPSNFVCVDDQPEYFPGGNGNENGKLFYAVKAVCGSLPCPPYVNDNEILCVVCTR